MGLFGFFKRREKPETPEGKHPLFLALQAGGSRAEQAFDVLQGKLGPIFRSGGSEAIKAFSEFYDIACDVGNPDSVKRFADRFLPLLPLSDRQVAMRKCGLDGSAGSAAAQYIKKREEALRGLADALEETGITAKVLAQVHEQTRAELRKGGEAGRGKYVEVCERMKKNGHDEELRQFEREYFPLLPRADRDFFLRAMLPSYREDREFVRATSGLDERTVLDIIEKHYLGSVP